MENHLKESAEVGPKESDSIVQIIHEQNTASWARLIAPKTEVKGTGYFVGRNGSDCTIRTDSHVVSNRSTTPFPGGEQPSINIPLDMVNPGQTKVILPSGKTVDAEVVENSPQFDRAILNIKTSDAEAVCKPVSLGSSEHPHSGEYVTALGFGDSDQLHHEHLKVMDEITVGELKSRAKGIFGADAKNWNTDMSILVLGGKAQHGDSGGPIIGKNGRVIGTTLAVADVKAADGTTTFLTFATPISMFKVAK